MSDFNALKFVADNAGLNIFKALEKAYEQGRTDAAFKWIPVSERCPKKKGEYLVTYHPCYWGNVQDVKCVGIDTFRGKTSWAKNKYQRVIAWAEKPEPWEGE